MNQRVSRRALLFLFSVAICPSFDPAGTTIAGDPGDQTIGQPAEEQHDNSAAIGSEIYPVYYSVDQLPVFHRSPAASGPPT
ncbi:MAG: hypothetical protein AAF745_17475, partial [Planctomycetota bacterium]